MICLYNIYTNESLLNRGFEEYCMLKLRRTPLNYFIFSCIYQENNLFEPLSLRDIPRAQALQHSPPMPESLILVLV